jgi:hypothetical protein
MFHHSPWPTQLPEKVTTNEKSYEPAAAVSEPESVGSPEITSWSLRPAAVEDRVVHVSPGGSVPFPSDHE